MVETVERLVATLEADIRGFTKNMAEAQRQFDQRAAAIERRQTGMVGRLNTSFGRLDTQSLINRYASWGFAITLANRLVRESIEVNAEAAASWARLDDTLSGLANSAGPTVAAFFNELNEIIKDEAKEVEKLIALWERAKQFFGVTPQARTGGIPFANAEPTFATFNKGSGNWNPSIHGFPVPGVTDITPEKQTGKTVAERERAIYLDTMAILDDLINKRHEANQDFMRQQGELAQELRNQGGGINGATEQDLADLDDFHARANQAWADYYEGVAQLADEAATLEQERVADRIAEIGDAFEYLGHAALLGGDAFKRALADMVQSLAVSGLRSLFEAGLTSLVDGGGFFGNLIAGRAAGGPVSAGTPYMVGERGPKLFVPKMSGNIIPNASAAKSGGGPIVINMPIDARGAQAGVAEQITRVAPAIVDAAVRQVARNFGPMAIRYQRDQA